MEIVGGAILLISLAASAASSTMFHTEYGKWVFGRIDGYRERKLSSNSWQVIGDAFLLSGKNFGTNMALYRASLLAKSAGFNYIDVVDLNIRHIFRTNWSSDVAREVAKVKVFGINDVASPLPCEAKKQDAPNCRVLAVDKVIEELGPLLDQSPDNAAGAIAGIRDEMTKQNSGDK